MRLAIQNMATFSASFPTNFPCCCLLNQKCGCLKHWMDAVWRGKELVKLSRIYFSMAKIWRHFRGLTKCYPWIVRKWCLQVKPAKKLFRMKRIKQKKRAKRQSKYEYKDVVILFHASNSLSSCRTFPWDEIRAEIESCSFTKICAIISMCENYLTKSRYKLNCHHFLMSTLNSSTYHIW